MPENKKTGCPPVLHMFCSNHMVSSFADEGANPDHVEPVGIPGAIQANNFPHDFILGDLHKFFQITGSQSRILFSVHSCPVF